MATEFLIDDEGPANQAAVGVLMVAENTDSNFGELVACLVDTEGGERVCAGLGRCWTTSHHNQAGSFYHNRIIRYYDACEKLAQFTRDLTDYGNSGVFPSDPTEADEDDAPLGEFYQAVDGAGNFWQYGWNFKESPSLPDTFKEPEVARVRVIDRDGNEDNTEFDVTSDVSPPATHPDDGDYDLVTASGIVRHIEIQEAGLALYSSWEYDRPSPADTKFLWFMSTIDDALTLTDVGPLQTPGGTLARCNFLHDPLPQGSLVIAVTDVDISTDLGAVGRIDASGELVNLADPSPFPTFTAGVPHYYDDAGNLYIALQKWSASWVDVTPSWMSALDTTFIWPNRDGSRFFCYEEESISEAAYRVRDSSGNIITEVIGPIGPSSPVLATKNLLGGIQQGYTQQDIDGGMVYLEVSTTPFGVVSGLTGVVMKHAEDSIVATRVLGAQFETGAGGITYSQRAGMFVRGQYPLFDYTAWD